MNKNIQKGKVSEAKIMEFLKRKGPSRLREIGTGCGAAKGEEISWSFSVCKRLLAQGLIAKNKIGSTVFYDLLIRDDSTN